jgi:DNA-binding winged helix-turn-helix (wHTH) protein
VANKGLAPRFCIDCGIPLGKWAAKRGTRRCRKHAPATPQERARRADNMRRVAARPEIKARAREHARTVLHSAQVRERRAERQGQRSRNYRKAHLAWCPKEYWGAYYRLCRRQVYSREHPKCKRVGAALAREIIERHIGGPLRRVRMTAPQMLRDECTVGGELVRFAPSSFKVLLTLLVNRPNRYVTNAQLIERIWPNPDLEPSYARSVVRQYVLDLRRAGVRVVRWPGRGYRIPAEARGPASNRHIDRIIVGPAPAPRAAEQRKRDYLILNHVRYHFVMRPRGGYDLRSSRK